MTKLSGNLHKTPSGLYTYDIGADAILLFPLATKLQEKFKLDAGQFPAFGPDTLLVELTKGDHAIFVGWDIWSDLFVMARNVQSNGLMKEISVYLGSIMGELEELEEKLIAQHEEENTK